MVFPILGGNGAVAGYEIANSLRFNDDDSPSLTRTPSTSNRKTFTISLWVKRANLGSSSEFKFFGTGTSGTESALNFINDSLRFYQYTGGGFDLNLTTNRLFRDTSAFYHIQISVDTSQATSSNRLKLYINGIQETSFSSETYPSLNFDTLFNYSSSTNIISNMGGQSVYFDGYMAEINFIDGQALSPTDFGEFDEDSGIWKPKAYEGSYGTNGFYLDFENSGSLGADQSGNGNNFTPTNLASTDQMIDTPTRNFCTMNPLDRLNIGGANSEQVTSEGNLKSTGTSSEGRSIGSTFAITPNGISKAYAEWYSVSGSTSKDLFYSNNINGYIANDDATAGNIVMIAVDCVAGKYWFGNNGTWDASGDPANGTNPTGTFTANSDVQFGHRCYDSSRSQVVNFGQDSTFAGNTTRQSNTDSNGEGDFYYTPPTGFLSLNSSNLSTEASPTIDDGSQYFNTVLYTGDGTTNRTISGVGFQPDFTWLKRRSSVYSHALLDSNRGGGKVLGSDNLDPEFTNNNVLSSWNSDGFVIALSGVSAFSNTSGQTYAGWNWKANGGTTSSNTDGSITSTVQANTTAGFSIVTYTGTGSAGTVGHGLGVAPKMVIVKRRDSTGGWWIHNTNLTSASYGIRLDTTGAEQVASAVFNNTFPTSTVFSLGTNAEVNTSSATMVAYCFAEIEGYSKFGSYIGNGNADGAFVYTGFRPAFVLIKRTTGTEDWFIYDSVRDTFNAVDSYLKPNTSGAEATASYGDLLSNGFKARNTFAALNASGEPYIYMAFAESPFVTSSGVPVVAR